MLINNNSYQERTYREKVKNDRFVTFSVCHFETDLQISVDTASFINDMKTFIIERIKFYRKEIESFTLKEKQFYTSLIPLKDLYTNKEIVSEMLKASIDVNIGPMATVAGAFSQFIGFDIINMYHVKELIIENGGDIFIKVLNPVTVSIFAGNSVLSENIGLKIPQDSTPLGICTSAGTVGHSLSFGNADAVVIACKNTVIADAYATKFGNMLKEKSDLNRIIELIKGIKDIISAVIILEGKLGICGNFNLTTLNNN